MACAVSRAAVASSKALDRLNHCRMRGLAPLHRRQWHGNMCSARGSGGPQRPSERAGSQWHERARAAQCRCSSPSKSAAWDRIRSSPKFRAGGTGSTTGPVVELAFAAPAPLLDTPPGKSRPASPGAEATEPPPPAPASISLRQQDVEVAVAAAPQPPAPPPLLQQYHLDSGLLFEACAALYGLGSRLQLEAPTLVVGGDQGSGKSSLVSRLCGLDLPLSPIPGQHGLRCPLIIQLFSSQQPGSGPHRGNAWFQVKLRRTHDVFSGAALPHALTSPFLGPLTDAQHVAPTLLKAQCVLLNPGRPEADFHDYLPLDMAANELQATRNAVVLEVHGGLLPSPQGLGGGNGGSGGAVLTVVDLPGLVPHGVAHAPDAIEEEQLAARLHRESTLEYMRLPHAVIVSVLSLTTDVAHQGALDLARKADPSGRRSLGVLTHARGAAAVAHARGARELVCGHVLPLRRGYVVWPGEGLPDGGGAAGAAGDDGGNGAMGAGGAPLAAPVALLLQEAQQAHRLGEQVVGQLVASMLTEQLAAQLPPIRAQGLVAKASSCKNERVCPDHAEQVAKQVAELDRQLSLLRPAARPDDLAQHARAQLRALARAFEAAARGTAPTAAAAAAAAATASSSAQAKGKPLVQDIMTAFRQFSRRVVSTRPRFQLACVAPPLPRSQPPQPHRSASSSSMDGGGEPPCREPILARYGEEDEEGDPLWHRHADVTTLEDVKRLIAAERGAELAVGVGDGVHDGAARALIRQFQARWQRDAEGLLDVVTARVLDEVAALVAAHFAGHERLGDLVKGFCMDLVALSHEQCRGQLALLADMELGPHSPPFTLLDRHFTTLQDVLASSMHTVRSMALKSQAGGGWAPLPLPVEERSTKVEAVRQLLRELGTDTQGWTDQQLLDRLGVATTQEQDGAAIRVMATCMAYFKVSSRRFRDAVPMLVRHHLVHAVALSFDEHMLRSLEAYAASASSHHGGVGSAHGAGGTAPPPASLGWAGSPAVLSLMAGGPLDAAQLARRGELEAERAALGGILARLNAMLEPLA